MSHHISFESLPWQSKAKGQRFKAYAENGKQIRVMELTPEFVEAGWCLKGHIGYVLEGVMELEFEDDVTLVRAGDGLFIPAGEAHKHKARALTPLVSVVLVEQA
jgi:quercetin dioxygenase-like cupin family protein